MPNTALPQRRSELIARIQESRAALDALIGALAPEQTAAPGPDGGWSVKDHLAHMAAWQCVAYLRVIGHMDHEHEVFGMDPVRYEATDADGLNAAVYQSCKDRTLAEVRATFEQAYQQVLGALAQLHSEDLQRPVDPAQPHLGTLVANVAGNTYEHFEEHAAWIRAALPLIGAR
ncbi:MAG TPA: DinB family protein [Ktedonobacterales bacterium]|jgi:hypothetical protein